MDPISTEAGSQQQRILLLDDDENFGQLMLSLAQSKGIHLVYFPSLSSMGSFARLGEFHLILLDLYLDKMQGTEIAQYVDTFWQNTPAVLISAERQENIHCSDFPRCIKGFICKDIGAIDLLDQAINLGLGAKDKAGLRVVAEDSSARSDQPKW